MTVTTEALGAAGCRVGAVLAALGLGVVPVANVGDTAITDHVFLWGVDGLSVWNRDATAGALGWMQAVAFGVAVVLLSLALIGGRWRTRLTSFAGVGLAVAAAATWAHASRIASSASGVLLMPDGVALVAALALLLLGAALAARRRARD